LIAKGLSVREAATRMLGVRDFDLSLESGAVGDDANVPTALSSRWTYPMVDGPWAEVDAIGAAGRQGSANEWCNTKRVGGRVGLQRQKRVLSAVLIVGLFCRPAAAQMTNLPTEVRTAIVQMGPRLDDSIASRTYALMQRLQAPRAGLAVGRDVGYGEDPLQKLDLYAPHLRTVRTHPVVIFVHGGDFTGGDKRNGDNVAAYFARHGMLGVAMNYRLAPAVTWPEQSLDVGKVVSWLCLNAARYGGDPHRMIVIGFSTGASVVASYIFDQSIQTTRDGVVGAVLMSGGFGYGSRKPVYYGEDPAKAAERQPRAHINQSTLPVLIVTAEFDPPNWAAESLELAAAICRHRDKCPPFLWLSGHNHISEAASIDTPDDRLGHEILGFVGAVAK
jgi:acetyl esterase